MAPRPARNASLPLHPPLWLYLFLFIAVFAVYTLTLNPSLFRNDSPETITACFTLGVSHPPGYPLHTLLGRLFSLIPLGNPAMTLNFFAALLGAVGASLFAANLWLVLGALSLEKNKTDAWGILGACLAGTLCFAFSRNYWSVSLAAKGGIYNFQVVLELAFLWSLLCLVQDQPSKEAKGKAGGLYWLVFLFSLGLANHWPSLILLVPALALAAFLYRHYGSANPFRDLGPKQLLISLTLLIVVLSLYLYLPLRANLDPSLNFGTPSNLDRFLGSLSRAHYFKTETLASFIPTALSTMEDKAVYISDRFGSEFSVFFSLFSILGAWLLLRRGFRIELLFLLVLLLTTVAANILYLQVSPIEYWHMDDHLLTVNWATALLAAVGLYGFGNFGLGRAIPKYGVLLLFVVLSLLTLYKNLPFNNQTREFVYQGYGMEALKSMAPNARYFAESDYDYFSILYLKQVEHKRKDVDLALTSLMGEKDWQDLLKEESSRIPDPRPVYCAFPNGDFINGYLKRAPRAAFMPVGTIVRFMPPREAIRKRPELRPLEELGDRYIDPELKDANPINGLLLELCAHPYLNMADYLAFRHDFRYWDLYYLRALALIQDPAWRYATWMRMKAGRTGKAH